MDQKGQTRPKWIEWDELDQMDHMNRTGTKWTKLDPNGLKSIEQYLHVGNSGMVIKDYRTKFMNFKISRGSSKEKQCW